MEDLSYAYPITYNVEVRWNKFSDGSTLTDQLEL